MEIRKKRVRKDEKREVTPEFVNMSKEILYPQIQGVTMGETISFAPRKAIKSQVLADFVAEWVDTQLPTAPIQPELWTMFFDGSLMKTGAGAGLLFISPLGNEST
jgi:hypothetical protein